MDLKFIILINVIYAVMMLARWPEVRTFIIDLAMFLAYRMGDE